MRRTPGGFTLVELVMTIVIIGILGAVAAPRMFGEGVFQSRGFSDRLKATVRHAQQLAIAQQRFVCVGMSERDVTLTLDAIARSPDHEVASCPGRDLTELSGRRPYVVTAPDGMTLGGATSFSFDAAGRPSSKQDIDVNGVRVVVEAETGYVH